MCAYARKYIMINREMGLLGQMGPLGRKMLVPEVAVVPKRQKARSSTDDRALQLAELTRLELATFAVTGRCSNQLRYNSVLSVFQNLAELTRLELATFAVTGRCSNQLRYNSRFCQMSFSNDAH